MTYRIAMIACALLLAGTMPTRAAGPFAAPVKACHPCRFSPGPGQPTFDLTFVFQGTGDQKALAALDVAPEGGGAAQRLDAGGLLVTDFPDGFTLDQSDLNFDGLGDLSIITQEAADNTDAAYWLYEPATKRFVPLERVGDDGNESLLSAGPGHRLFSEVRGSAVEYVLYAYRIVGNRAVAVAKDSRAIDGSLIVDTRYDLTVKPSRETRHSVVGFSGDSPARTAFRKQLDAAAKQAAALYRRGNAAGAAAAMAAAIGDKQLALLTSSYPITGDPGDLTLVRQFNDYGFYLEQAKQLKRAIDVLGQVTDVDDGRTVAYLNLADAQYAAGQGADAKANYAAYRKRMVAAGKQAAVPARVADRLGAAPAPAAK